MYLYRKLEFFVYVPKAIRDIGSNHTKLIPVKTFSLYIDVNI